MLNCQNKPDFMFDWWRNRNKSKQEATKVTEQENSVNKELTDPPVKNFGYSYPVWLPMKHRTDYVSAVRCIPQLYATINILSTNFSRGKYRHFKKQSNGKKVELFDTDLLKLLRKPNPIQNGKEFLQQYYSYWQIDGNGYLFWGVPSTMLAVQGVTSDNLNTIWPLPSEFMEVITTGIDMLRATEKKEIIEKYILNFDGITSLLTESVAHINLTTLDYRNTFGIVGDSPIQPLQKPLSNIDKAYKARNVGLVEGKGITAASPKPKESLTGGIPIPSTPGENKIDEERFKGYGLQPEQSRLWVLTKAYDIKPIGWTLQEMEIFEGIEDDAATIANQFSVPFDLLRKKTAKFENKKFAQKELFIEKLIPDAEIYDNMLQEELQLDEKKEVITYTFDHLPELQQDRETSATVHSITTTTILSIQESVANGNTERSAGIIMIADATGKTPEEAAVYLPKPKNNSQPKTVSIKDNGQLIEALNN